MNILKFSDIMNEGFWGSEVFNYPNTQENIEYNIWGLT